MSDDDIRDAVESNDPTRPQTFQETLDPYWRSLNLDGDPPEVLPVRSVTLAEANDVHFESRSLRHGDIQINNRKLPISTANRPSSSRRIKPRP